MAKVPAILSKQPYGLGALGASNGAYGADSPAVISQVLGGALQGYKGGGAVKHMREGGSTMDPYELASSGYSNSSAGDVNYGGDDYSGPRVVQPSGSGSGTSSAANPNTWTQSEVQGFLAKYGPDVLLGMVGGPAGSGINWLAGKLGYGTVGDNFRSYINGLPPSETARILENTSNNDLNHFGPGNGTGTPSTDFYDPYGENQIAGTGTDSKYGAFTTDATGVRVFTDKDGDPFIIGADGKPDYKSSQADAGGGDGISLNPVTVSGGSVPTGTSQTTTNNGSSTGTGTLAPVTITGTRDPATTIAMAPAPGPYNGAVTMPNAPMSPAPAPTTDNGTAITFPGGGAPTPPAPHAPTGTPTPSPSPTPGPGPAPAPGTDFAFPGTNLGTLGNHRLVAYDPNIMGGVDAARTPQQQQLQQLYLQTGIKPDNYTSSSTGMLTNGATASHFVDGKLVQDKAANPVGNDPSAMQGILNDALNANPQILHDPGLLQQFGQNLISQYNVDPRAYQTALGNYLAGHPLYQGMGLEAPGGLGSMGNTSAPAASPVPPLVSHTAVPAPAPGTSLNVLGPTVPGTPSNPAVGPPYAGSGFKVIGPTVPGTPSNPTVGPQYFGSEATPAPPGQPSVTAPAPSDPLNGYQPWTGGGPPNMAQLMAATGMNADQASRALYGSIGGQVDTRNWADIMSGKVSAGQATNDMYGGTHTSKVQTGTDKAGNPTYTTYITDSAGSKLTSIDPNTPSALRDSTLQSFGLPTTGDFTTTYNPTTQSQTMAHGGEVLGALGRACQ